MRRITSRNTKPEMIVRSAAQGLGYRYRLHAKDLPGKPDLVFRRRKAVIFVHGCFWHLHSKCREGRIPASNKDYWEPKLNRTIARDADNRRLLKDLGWKVLTLWECELASQEHLIKKLTKFLGPASEGAKILVKPSRTPKSTKPPINTGDKSFQNLA
jgi:DNA mismatch endonuclease Vsr